MGVSCTEIRTTHRYTVPRLKTDPAGCAMSGDALHTRSLHRALPNQMHACKSTIPKILVAYLFPACPTSRCQHLACPTGHQRLHAEPPAAALIGAGRPHGPACMWPHGCRICDAKPAINPSDALRSWPHLQPPHCTARTARTCNSGELRSAGHRTTTWAARPAAASQGKLPGGLQHAPAPRMPNLHL